MLGDNNLRHPLPIHLLLGSLLFPILRFAFLRGVQVPPVDHQDQIGILFDGTRFPKIGKERSPVRPALDRSTELGQGDDRNVQFFGDGLQRPGNDRDLLLTVLAVVAPGHQLKIIDHHKIEAGFRLLPTDLGAHFEGANARRVVNEYPAVAQLAGCAGEARPIFPLQLTGPNAMHIQGACRAQQAHAQLLLGHLQAKDGHLILPGVQRCVQSHPQSQAGLACARPPGHDNQIGGLEAGGPFIQIRKPRRNAGDLFLLFVQLVDVFHRIGHDSAHWTKRAPHPAFRNPENVLLGVVQQFIDPFGSLIPPSDDLRRHVDENAVDPGLVDKLGVIGHAGRRRHRLSEVGQVRATPDRFERSGVLEVVGEGHEIDHLIVFRQGDHGLKDLTVLGEIKLVRADDLEGFVERLVVQENGPEDGFLSFEILRW